MLDSRPLTKDRSYRHRLWKRIPGRWFLYALYVAVAGLLIAGGIVVKNSRPAKVDPRVVMIRAGQAIVQANLAEGLQTHFADDSETVVDTLPEGKFMISAWVDLITKAGRHDRKNYSVVVHKGEEDSWVGERVTVIP